MDKFCLQLMLVVLALISAAESNGQIVNQKYATLQSFYLGCPLVGSKGQLNSKCLFGAIVWTKKPTKFIPEFLPQPLKRGLIKKIKALYYTNQGLFNIIKFLIQLLFRGQGRNPGKNFVGFLVQTMAPKRHFEIN